MSSLEERINDLSASLDAARIEAEKCQSALSASEEAKSSAEKECSELQARVDAADRELQQSQANLDNTRHDVGSVAIYSAIPSDSSLTARRRQIISSSAHR